MRTGDAEVPQAAPLSRLIERLQAFPWLPVLPVVLGPILLFAGSLFTGQVLFWGTPSLQFVPWRAYAWQQLLAGELPLWNSLNGMGAPLAANYQLALFYPPGWLSFLFAALGGTPAMAWSQTLLIVLHLILAGLGMAALARRYGLSPLAQAIAGLSFSLCGYLVARVEFFSMIWAGAWLPWVLLAASRIAAPDRPEWLPARGVVVPLLVLVAALQLLSGHAQLTWYTFVLAGVWVATGGWQAGRWRGLLQSTLRYGVSLGLAALIAAVQLIPTYEYLRESHRAAAVAFDHAMSYSFWPWRLIGFVAPNFFGNPAGGDFNGYANYWEGAVYVGFLPFALALTTVRWLMKRASRRGKPVTLLVFLWSSIFIGTVLAFGHFTPLFPWLYQNVPTFDMFQAPARWMIWPAFSIAMLAALAVDRWRPAAELVKRKLRLGMAAAAAVILAGGIGWGFLGENRLPMFAATASAGVFGLVTLVFALVVPAEKTGKARARWTALLVVFVAADLILAGWGLNPAVNAEIYSNPGAHLPAEVAALDGERLYLPPDDEYVLKFGRFFRFEDFRPIDDWILLRTILLPNINQLDDVAMANNFDPMVPARYARWMDRLAELRPEDQVPWLQAMGVGLVERVDVTSPVGVRFQQISGAQRVTWWGCAQAVSGEPTAWEAVERRMTGREGCLIVEGAEQIDLQTGSDPNDAGEAWVRSESANQVIVQVDASEDGWVRLADVWYPGWKAYVDGDETPLLRADTLFRAVFLPAGRHTVAFRYEPASYRTGLFLTGLGLTLLAAFCVFLRNRAGKYN